MSQERTGTPGRHGSPRPDLGSAGNIDHSPAITEKSLEDCRTRLIHLKESASHLTSLDTRLVLFEAIVVPVPPSLSDLQIHALNTLTNKGQNLDLLESELVVFLNKTLTELFFTVEKFREESTSIGNRDNIWTNENVDRRTGSGGSLRKSKNQQRGKVNAVEELSGPEKALMDIFYLVSDTVTHHPHAFRDAQLEILLSTATMIARKTTMRRALRGVLKIFSAITSQLRIPNTNIKPTIMALCTILGNAAFKFREEAWLCLSNLLQSEDGELVGNIIIDPLLSPLRNPDNCDQAKLKGALISIGRIAQTTSLAKAIIPSLRSVITGLANTYELKATYAAEYAHTVLALLSNDMLTSLFAEEDWSHIQNRFELFYKQVHPDDRKSQASSSEIQLQAKINDSSPFHGYPMLGRGSRPYHHTKSGIPLQAIAEQLLSLLERQWSSLNFQKSSLVLCILLYLAHRAPSTFPKLIDRMWDIGLFQPIESDWSAHTQLVMDIIDMDCADFDFAKSSLAKVFQLLYPLLHQHSSERSKYDQTLSEFLRRLNSCGHQSANVLNALARLCSDVGSNVSLETFDVFLELFQNACLVPDNNSQTLESLSNLVQCLTHMFLDCYQHSFARTNRLYHLMLAMLGTLNSTSIKLHLAKLLIRLRCNADFALTVGALPVTESVMKNLCKPQPLGGPTDVDQSSSGRPATQGHTDIGRTGRTSMVDLGSGSRSRSATRSINAKDRRNLIIPPTWVHAEAINERRDESVYSASLVVYVRKSEDDDTNVLDLGRWLDCMIETLKSSSDWELYTFVLLHLPSQLRNCSLFRHHVRSIQILHNTIVMQLYSGDFHEPPPESGIKKGDIAVCLYQILTAILPYHDLFNRKMTDDTIRTFRAGIEKWDRSGKTCIRALALCCYEMPFNLERHINGITEMMQKRVTQADLAMDILEFLGCLARVRDAYGEADAGFYRRIFGICIRYLQSTWEQRQRSGDITKHRVNLPLSRTSGSSSELVRAMAPLQSTEVHGLSEYVFTLAYQTIIFWFLAIDVRDRAQHVGWLTQELSWKDEFGREHIQEQSLVILDMMHRTAFSDMGETEPDPEFLDANISIIRRMWLVGMSIITTETILDQHNGHRQRGQLIKRQASGTTHATYFHNTPELPEHHIAEESRSSRLQNQTPLDVYPNHMFLQLISTIAPVPIPLQPIPLPADEFTLRALKVFDSINTVDGHKAGVIYIREGQDMEGDILANTAGNDAYQAFLSRLGTKVRLKDAKFNPQGLDRQTDEDGTHTIAWRDRVTEIVFHVTTMMPTDSSNDPKCDKKKRHVGNDHVKIIFNTSGQQFDFDTFPSAMNTINILITPEAHSRGTNCDMEKVSLDMTAAKPIQMEHNTDRFGYFVVQTLSSPSYPEMSFAAEPKIVSAETLAPFVRQMAINASVFSQVWESRHDEYFSCWRTRLREILKLRKRYSNTNTSANVHYPMANSEPSVQYGDGDTWSGRITIGGMADGDKLVNSMDFTRWT